MSKNSLNPSPHFFLRQCQLTAVEITSANGTVYNLAELLEKYYQFRLKNSGSQKKNPPGKNESTERV